MNWKIFNLAHGKMDYSDISKNRSPISITHTKQNISTSIKIGVNIYNVCMLDLVRSYIGVREVNFVSLDDVETTKDENFTCPYCNHIDNDAFELGCSGEVNCPRCNSELSFETEVRCTYIVTPVRRAKVRMVE